MNQDHFIEVETHPAGSSLRKAAKKWGRVNSGNNGRKTGVLVRLNGADGGIILVFSKHYAPLAGSNQYLTVEEYLAGV